MVQFLKVRFGGAKGRGEGTGTFIAQADLLACPCVFSPESGYLDLHSKHI